MKERSLTVAARIKRNLMIMIATLVIMLACAWFQYRNGLFTSVTMLIMVFLSGLVAFGFWEPIADILDPMFQNQALAGCEDLIALMSLFCVTLLALRVAAIYLNPEMIDEHGALQHLGAMGVGLITGYFVAGFLICTMQTLPIEERFLDFEQRSSSEPAYRSFFPPDRVWLALMRHAGASPFTWKEEPSPAGDTNLERYITFDRSGTFELRYARYRRSNETRGPMPYLGEFDRDLSKQKPR